MDSKKCPKDMGITGESLRWWPPRELVLASLLLSTGTNNIRTG